ncbi:twitching motility protein PilT [Rhodothermaceae bacterium RA]|nr:twitching motility protein PilT [Rhodothermaceae bacterium RA]
MRLLLDTHTLVWWHAQPVRLSEAARTTIEEPGNEVYISVVNAWEMQIKSQLGKLKLSRSVMEIIEQEQKVNGFQVLPVTLEHVYTLERLPLHHRDPFDRLLIAQAEHGNLTLITADDRIKAYEVNTRW